MVKDYFASLSADDQTNVETLVDGLINDISVEDEATGEKTIRLPMLMAVLQKLNDEKKSAKEADAEKEKAKKEADKAAAEIAGAERARTISVGDIITFSMGTGKNKKEYSLPVLKKSDKSCTVAIPVEDLPEDYKTDKRYIKFANITAVEHASAEKSAVVA
jgi:hypothetical protein